jgi:hypothetical protein
MKIDIYLLTLSHSTNVLSQLFLYLIPSEVCLHSYKSKAEGTNL